MEKASNNGQNGVLRMPPGFRFHPTDMELVLHYLKRKIYSCPLPAAIIPDIDLSEFDPWEFPGVCEEARYVFNIREAKYQNGNRSNRTGRSGFWKATGKDKPIVFSKTNQMIGIKKVFVFYKGKPSSGSRTDYIMHEYQLAGPESRACFFPERKNSVPSVMVTSGDWVLCRIFKKKRATRLEGEIEEDNEEDRNGNSSIQFIDFTGQQNRYPNPNPSSVLPESSCVTELCVDSNVGEETSPAI